jgi:hypothetical protein
MVGKIQKILMVGLFSVTSSAYSMETLIDFEDQEQAFEIPELAIQNVTFSMPEVGANLVQFYDYWENSLGTDDLSNMVLLFDGVNTLTFSFENTVSDFSFNWLSLSYLDAWQLTAFDESNELVGSTLLSLSENERFGSFSSPTDNISYATLTREGAVSGLGSDVLMIDNFRYTGVSPVPEPSTYALMLGGLGLVGFMAYRRKKMLS